MLGTTSGSVSCASCVALCKRLSFLSPVMYIYTDSHSTALIPTTIGNMIGGGIFVASAYWYLYLTGEAGVKIQFDTGGINSAVEGGAGPLKLEGRDPEELDGLRRQLGINGKLRLSPHHMRAVSSVGRMG